MRVSTRLLVFFAVFGMFVLPAFSACTQSNLTAGVQASGALYGVWMPETTCWNGNFVVFAHGYVAPNQGPGVPADQLTIGGISLPATFNQLGYGFAASGYSKNGLAIIQGVASCE